MPLQILISRIIFEHTNYDPSEWDSEYSFFFEKHLDTLRGIHNLSRVLLFFRKRNGCKHTLLAVDELIQLHPESKGINSSTIQDAIKALASAAIGTDGIHTIISSLVTNPFEEYIRGSQHTPHFVRLTPLLESLDHLSKLLAEKREDESTESTIWQLLLSTGGHPRLIEQLIPWLLTVSKENMVFVNATSYEGLVISGVDNFSEDLQRLFFTGGCVPSKDISAVCGSSGILSRPTAYNAIYSVVIPPLVLYSLLSRSSKYIDMANVPYLVPFRMSSVDKFEKFIACWFSFQFKLGRSPRTIFSNYDGASAFLLCTNFFNMSEQTNLFEFQNRSAFIDFLPNFASTFIDLNLDTTGSVKNLFGLKTLSEGYRVWVIEKQNNRGFDIMISFSSPINGIKKVLLVQCKTKLVNTSDEGGKGQLVTSTSFSDSLVNCSEFVKVLESNQWEVGFLGLYSCNTSKRVIPKSCPAGVSPAFFERSAAIGNIGLFNLLGDSFGLALELAKGHKLKFHRTLGKSDQLD